jgi:hypothetical protein
MYGYAVYKVTVGGQTLNQPVIDWMDKEPLNSTSFTYQLLANAARPQFQQIQARSSKSKWNGEEQILDCEHQGALAT